MSMVLDVRALQVTRGQTPILQGLDWRVERGQHWVILGPNGSGKTSLLKSLTGYLSPTAGEIEVLGRTYGRSDWRDLRLEIGVVTSAFAASIPPAETALETVLSGRFGQLDLWARPTRLQKAAAGRLLRGLRIGSLAARPWLYLSQGERQRVLIARALMTRPRILILDEPCAGLDPVARSSFLEFVERLGRRRTGPVLVLVTHHVEEITSCFTHALLLRNGRPVATGPLRKVMNTATLSRTFGATIRLRSARGRYRLDPASSRA